MCSTPGVPTSGTGSGIWAGSYPVQQLNLTKPTIDTGYYSSADLNKITHDCAATTPGGAALATGLFKLDNDSTRNTSLQIPAGSGGVSLLHLKNTNQADTGNNFDCRWYDGTGALVGQLTWVDGNPGTLTVHGTAYIDGNLSLTANDKAVYNGVGVIYVDGTVSMSNGARLCAARCRRATAPARGTRPRTTSSSSPSTTTTPRTPSRRRRREVQGILFANGNFYSSNSGSVFGSVIADSGQMSGDAKFGNPTPAPPGAPGGPTTTTTRRQRRQRRGTCPRAAGHSSEWQAMTTKTLTHRLRDESGSMLIELMIAMTFLAIAVGAILSVYTSSLMSLRHSSIEGNALTLVDRQLELYNTLPSGSIQLDSSTIPGGSDPYVTAHSADATIPSSTGQVTGATGASCTAVTTPQAACATQTATGPDGRSYRVDTYIVNVQPNSGYTTRTVKAVTVVVRTMTGGTPGSIAARSSLAYDPCNPPPSTPTTSC